MVHGVRISDRDIRDIAEAADVRERSVLRRIAGLPVKGRAGVRIDRIRQARFGTTIVEVDPEGMSGAGAGEDLS
jgi:hypothetical protein